LVGEIALLVLGVADPASYSAASSSSSATRSTSFDEVYKPLELTDFDSLFSKNIARTSDM
jgi:hypothetical protein